MEQQLNSSTGFWANDDQIDEDEVMQSAQTDAKPHVMRSACKCTCRNSLQYENCDKLCERWEAEQADA